MKKFALILACMMLLCAACATQEPGESAAPDGSAPSFDRPLETIDGTIATRPDPTIGTQPTELPTEPSAAPTQPASEPTPEELTLAELYVQLHDFPLCTHENVTVNLIGEFDGCQIAFANCACKHVVLENQETLGGCQFVYPPQKRLTVFRGNEMLELKDAFASGWITDTGLQDVYREYRRLYSDLYLNIEPVDPTDPTQPGTPVINAWVERAIRRAYEEQYGHECPGMFYYGKYGECYVVMFNEVGGDALTSETVGGYEFRYTSTVTLSVFSGSIKSLKEAYAAGWFAEEELTALYEHYRALNSRLYEKEMQQ